MRTPESPAPGAVEDTPGAPEQTDPPGVGEPREYPTVVVWQCVIPDCEYRINRAWDPEREDVAAILTEADQRAIAELSARHYIERHGAVDLVGQILDYVINRSHHSAEAREVMAMIERSGFGYGPAETDVTHPTSADAMPVHRDGAALAFALGRALDLSPRHGACTGGTVLVHRDYCPDHEVPSTSQVMVDWGVEVAPTPARTSMVAAVATDLGRMPEHEGGVDASLRALATYLSEAIDAHGGTGNPGTTARLAQELRTVLTELARRERSGDDEAAAFASGLSTPAVDVTPDPHLARRSP